MEAPRPHLALGAGGERGGFRVGFAAGGALDRPRVADRPRLAFGQFAPAAAQAATSFTSRVLAEPSAGLPVRSSVLNPHASTPVPSMPKYIVAARPRSAATSSPSASAARSACFASTHTTAKSRSSAPVSTKLPRATARPVIRTTPGDRDAPSMPSIRSRGRKPLL